jgi:energy-coupling factor transporter ATP-binding protein EcfA2
MGIRSEFDRFLTHLEAQRAPDDVRRLANIVMAHLPRLAEVGSARRARSARLAPIAINELPGAAIDRAAAPPPPDDDQEYLGRLHQLSVGPFRGFMRQETFDLSRDITLIYGANGTGKSSFCEALEASMLGVISEAQAKRLDYRTYCNNARLRRHDGPVLTTTNGNGAIIQFRASEDKYRFCFIEKNRLDDFARIAARTPADQRQLIATLFGVEQFSEFVRGFNPSLDENLSLAGTRALQLEARRNQLAGAENIIRTQEQKEAALQAQEQELAERIAPGIPFSNCVDWMLGTPEQPGRLPFVRTQLEAVPPSVYLVTPAKLTELFAGARAVHALLQAAQTELATRAADVSYAQLYGAVLSLAAGATACPACGTGLNAVTQNPFDRARLGLEQLAGLATIQQREQTYRDQLREAIRQLWEEMKRTVSAAAQVCPEQLQPAGLPLLPEGFDGDWLGIWVDGEARHWNALLALAGLIERSDGMAQAVLAQRAAMVQERGRLDAFALEIERLKTLRATAQHELAQSQMTVAQFDVTNRELIEQVAVEAATAVLHRRIKAAYDGFLPALHAYLTLLPGLLLQGLGERARDLYNAFNRGDPRNDLLHALHLPLTENSRIEVEFAGEPGTRFDALVMLSEGHIRCLGLAILMAKNIAQACPVIIFDDVINAIDDEHRDGIWRTFFEDGHFDGKQVILTSHAEEFLHRIQQELGAQRAGLIKRYKFLPRMDEYHLHIDTDPPTKNYVLLAEQALAADEKRDALRHARPALESLTDRLWTWLGRRADGRIELKLAGPRSPWELHNKCSKLRSSVARNLHLNASLPQILQALDALLGVNGGSIEWANLNSGVHDAQRDHEFERAAVQTIIQAVVALDAALAALTGG